MELHWLPLPPVHYLIEFKVVITVRGLSETPPSRRRQWSTNITLPRTTTKFWRTTDSSLRGWILHPSESLRAKDDLYDDFLTPSNITILPHFCFYFTFTFLYRICMTFVLRVCQCVSVCVCSVYVCLLYRKNTVMIHNSQCSDWLVVVKSVSLTVRRSHCSGRISATPSHHVVPCSQSVNQSINQSNTRLYSAVCHGRVRGT